MKFVNVGLGNYVLADRVIAVVNPESSPIKRLVQEAKSSNHLIDSTYGRRTRAVLIMDNGDVVLSPIQPSTIVSKNAKGTSKSPKEKTVDYYY